MMTFVSFVLFFALAIWGRRLRENAFRMLSPEQITAVVDKMANYTSAEMIPFAGSILGLLGIVMFRPEWIGIGFIIFAVVTVTLIAVLHSRTRNRFRTLEGLPAAFLSQYENSRIVTYCAFGVALGFGMWGLFL